MATSIQPKSKQQYVDFDEYIDYQLQKTRSMCLEMTSSFERVHLEGNN